MLINHDFIVPHQAYSYKFFLDYFKLLLYNVVSFVLVVFYSVLCCFLLVNAVFLVIKIPIIDS